MRNLTQCLAMFFAAALLSGCVDEKPNYAKNPDGGTDTPSEVGYLSLSGLEMKVIYDGGPTSRSSTTSSSR